ncbi:related to PNG1-protein with de-N-glycosylation function (N-glycanase) [Serendipita indica DSM 11827]|uniref:Related to PNG1-protein with de-N-glycosylation function (N-glycanase) n=1 Tax=Serendipita indica (strain DSM 11827) TaxID=1109443 RepID=G4TNH3_SERID|nr:related to PNG1-protein with de-N-glycosylation function (N-glycanase) [Serendipita indica DSM 11827]
MSDPLHEVLEVLLALYASKGRFPRPNAVTQQQRNAVRQAGPIIVRRLVEILGDAPSRAQSNALLETIRSSNEGINKYTDENLLALARSEIPVEELKKTADDIQASDKRLPCYEGEWPTLPLPRDKLTNQLLDALAEALVKWFKPNYFTWRDPIRCTACQGETQSIGMGQPTPDDLQGGAGRVELHQCKTCRTVVRFPRDLKYLMRSRTGRCGEFANLFALFINAVGLRGRYVWNAEDHVWNEYYSPGMDRWVHLDSCENARDQHLLYDVGWGKKQSYILAFGPDGAQDVSRAYIKDFAAALPRRNRISEGELEKALADVTRARRAGLSAERLAALAREDEGERRFIYGEQLEDTEDLPARQSGTAEWKAARGEDGKHSS